MIRRSSATYEFPALLPKNELPLPVVFTYPASLPMNELKLPPVSKVPLTGMFENPAAELRKAVELSGHSPGALGFLGNIYAVSGRRNEAQQVLDELKELAKRRYVSPYSVALIYGGLGDKDATFEWLEKAYRDGAYGLLYLKTGPVWDGVRSEPRFQDLMRRVGLPQ